MTPGRPDSLSSKNVSPAAPDIRLIYVVRTSRYALYTSDVSLWLHGSGAAAGSLLVSVGMSVGCETKRTPQ